jgi:hypothetical protein
MDKPIFFDKIYSFQVKISINSTFTDSYLLINT